MKFKDQMFGLATCWLGLHLVGFIMFQEGHVGRGHLFSGIHQFMYDIWVFELWILGIVSVVAVTYFIIYLCSDLPEETCLDERENIISVPKMRPATTLEPPEKPKPPPKPHPTPEEMKQKALNQILGKE